MIPYVRGACEGDVNAILKVGLRKADRKECEAQGISEDRALRESFELSPGCLTVMSGGKPVAMFGVAPVPGDSVTGIVWFLGTDGITKITTRFLRESRKWLDHISAPYELLTNVVHIHNTIHLRWLRWLGFTTLRQVGVFQEFVKLCATPAAKSASSSTGVSSAAAPKTGGREAS